ncbi:MAG TPA: hypothetical protein DG754_04190 [Bacteroidales bacterium]|nr:hypothetical protein [Bacteroidales bacterium]
MQKTIISTIALFLFSLGLTFAQTAIPFTYRADKLGKETKSIHFSANAPNGSSNFYWDFNKGMLTSTEESPTILSNLIGGVAFDVTLTYTLDNETLSTNAEVDIESVGETVLHPNKSEVIELRADKLDFLNIPNVFTPNGDGDNDFFKVEVTVPTQISLKVFSRSGMLVYEKVAALIHWDGKNYYGQDLPDGIYYYVIKDTKNLYNPATGFFYIYR